MATTLTPRPKDTTSHRTARPLFKVHARNHVLSLGSKTMIMGVINMTPDSFSHDGQWDGQASPGHVLQRARKMIQEGADILDIGGESTRPGAKPISESEELRRIIPIVECLSKALDIPISIDTTKPLVAREALQAGASIINTIEGVNPDPELIAAVKDYDGAIVLMHMQGTPKTMQNNIHYSNLIDDICQQLQKSTEICLESGIKSDKIIIDPGIGFGKTVEHNLSIIRHLTEFQSLNLPILIGTSRKSFIGKVLNKEVHERLMGTAATVCHAIINGAHIVRVHDIAPIKDIVLMTDALTSNP